VSAALRVAVIGARGRLGGFACGLFRTTPGFELVGAFDAEDDWRSGVRKADARVALEATRAGLGCEHGLALLEAGVRPVIATSGVSPDESARLDARARELGLGGIVVPNFSLGSWLLQETAERLARHFPAAEIIELHHDRKKDAPSGTALETARRMAAARDSKQDVPIHSVRLPGLYAHQEVLLSGPGEVLTLRHDMLGPAAFGPGLVAACLFAAKASGMARGIGAALDRH
jgi:4-hydroxy-tetrahydrodipicolinate reductase